jgi:hypothetical protein
VDIPVDVGIPVDADIPVDEHGMPLPGIDEFGLTSVDGNGLGVATSGAALTPALPISREPNGIPAREPPPGEVGNVAADEEATPLVPVPHVPVIAVLPGNDAPVPIPIPPPS